MCSHLSRPAVSQVTLLAFLFLAPLAAARQGGGEYRLLRPGQDGNLNWQAYHEVAGLAAERKKPVLVYFFETEKTVDNAQEMISAQLRLFPDEKVKSAAAGLICTKVDWTDPDAVTRAMVKEDRKTALQERRDRRRQKGGEGGGAPGEGDGPEGGGVDGGDEEEPEADSGPPALIMPVEKWPQEICIVLLDYRGREIERLSKISSNAGNFLTALRKAVAVNERNLKADEKAAEKAERERQREEEERARSEGSEEDAPGDDPDGDPGETPSPGVEDDE
jgi:hypothetical protein